MGYLVVRKTDNFDPLKIDGFTIETTTDRPMETKQDL